MGLILECVYSHGVLLTCLMVGQGLTPELGHGQHSGAHRYISTEAQAVVLLENAQGEVLQQLAFI